MVYIGLQANRLACALPPGWGALSRLQLLDLGSNGLEGQLPPAWGNMSGLEALNLEANNFEGERESFPCALANAQAACPRVPAERWAWSAAPRRLAALELERHDRPAAPLRARHVRRVRQDPLCARRGDLGGRQLPELGVQQQQVRTAESGARLRQLA